MTDNSFEQLWLDSIRVEQPCQNLDSVPIETAWDFLLRAAYRTPQIDARFQLEAGAFYLFSGAYGTGKAEMAEAYAGMLKQQGYEIFSVTGMDFGFSQQEILERVHWLFAAEKKTCILAAQLAESPYPELLMQLLAKHLRQSRRNQRELVFVLLCERTAQIIPALRRLLMTLPFALPNAEERQRYLAAQLAEVMVLTDDVNFSQLAQKTDGFQYHQLEQLVFLMKLTVKYEQLSEENPLDFAAMQTLSSDMVADLLPLIQAEEAEKPQEQNETQPIQVVVQAPTAAVTATAEEAAKPAEPPMQTSAPETIPMPEVEAPPLKMLQTMDIDALF